MKGFCSPQCVHAPAATALDAARVYWGRSEQVYEELCDILPLIAT